MNSNAYSFEKKQLSNYNYNYSQILNSYIIFLIIFGNFFYNILSFLKHGPSILDRIIFFFTIISLFVFIYYIRIKRFNPFRIFFDFLFSILLVFITYVYIYFPLNSLNKTHPSLFIILIISVIIWSFFINEKIVINRYLILILFFSFTLLFNIIINGIPNGSYTIFKINSFLVYTLIPCFYIFVVTDKQLIDILKSLTIYFIILTLIYGFFNLKLENYEFFEIFGGNYISTGSVYGIGFLYVFFDFKCKNILYRIIKLGILSIFSFFILNTGARGPIISLLFTIFISYLFYYFHDKIKIIYLSIFLALIIIFILTFNLSNPINFFTTNNAGIMRLMNSYKNIKMGNFNEFSAGRLYLYKEAYKNFLEKPLFGKGIGKNEKIGFYPHNSFLEIASQLGLFGFLPFIVLLIYWFYFFIKSEIIFWKISEYRLIKYLFIYFLIESLFSGTIFWNIQFWSLLALSGIIFTIENKYYKFQLD